MAFEVRGESEQPQPHATGDENTKMLISAALNTADDGAGVALRRRAPQQYGVKVIRGAEMD